jgi:orotate phosphoribosyltransferase
MPELSLQQQELARGLLVEGIIQFTSSDNKTEIKSGKKSIVYVEGRDIPSSPELYSTAIDAYVDVIRGSGLIEKNDTRRRLLCAVPQGPYTITGAVGRAAKAPLIQHRVGTKKHGIDKKYQGRYYPGDEVVMIEDTASTGASIIEEADSLISIGLNPIGAVALVDREMGARTLLKNHHIQFAAAITLRGILEYGLAEGIKGVTQTIYEDVLSELDPIEVAQNN